MQENIPQPAENVFVMSTTFNRAIDIAKLSGIACDWMNKMPETEAENGSIFVHIIHAVYTGLTHSPRNQT